MQSIKDRLVGYENEIEQLKAENAKLKSAASKPAPAAVATATAEPQGRAMIAKLNSLTGGAKIKYYRDNKSAIDVLYKIGLA